MLIPTTQALLYAQGHAQRLRITAGRHRHTPDGFSRELKRETTHELLIAEFEAWRLQQFLPTEAPNDPPGLPGAA